MMQVLEVFVSFIENFLGIWFPMKVLQNKRVDWKKNTLMALALTLVVSWLNQYTIFSMWLTLLGILLISIGSIWCYGEKFFDVVPVVGLFMMFVYACDFFSMSILGVITNNPGFANYAVSGLSPERSLFLIVTKSLLISIINLFGSVYYKYGIKNYAVKPLYFIELILLTYMVVRTFKNSDIDAVVLWIALFLLCVVGIYATIQKSIADEATMERQLEKEMNKLLVEEHKDFIDSYNSDKVFYHDLKNHYLVIKGLLAQKDYRKAEQYIEKIHHISPNVKVLFYTGNEILDLVLSQKVNIAKESGINVSVTVEPTVFYLTDIEMSSLISNLLDNAVEATQMVEGERWIEIVIRQIKDISFIKISNNYSKEPIENNDVFTSSKEDINFHGIGLTNIKRIVKKYDGEVNINYGDGIFSVTTSFFIKE